MNPPVLTVEYYPFMNWLRRVSEGMLDARLPGQQFEYAYRRLPQHLRWARPGLSELNFMLFGCVFRRAP